MTDDKLERVLEKVKKLIALSKSSNEHEASLALEKAQAILAEYNLSVADVEADLSNPQYIILRGPVVDQTSYRKWLLNAVPRMYFCMGFSEDVHTLSRSGKFYMRERYCIAGVEHNAIVAQMMFDYLVKAVDRLAKENADLLASKKDYWSYQTAFKVACAERLVQRINDRIEAAAGGKMKSESGGNLPALASMYDEAESALTKYLEGVFGGMEEQTSMSREYHALGFMAGQEAGDQISLDTQVGSRGASKLLK